MISNQGKAVLCNTRCTVTEAICVCTDEFHRAAMLHWSTVALYCARYIGSITVECRYWILKHWLNAVQFPLLAYKSAANASFLL